MLSFEYVLAASGIFKIFDPHWIEKFLHDISPWHYVVLFAIIFAESGILIGIFLPGDSILFVAGLLAAKGDMNILVLLPLLFIAAFSGDQAGYYIGRSAGGRFFSKEDAKILKKSHITKTHEFFEKHGPKTIVLARFVPIVRTLAPIMAGTGKMKYKTFVTYNVVGAAIWGVGVTLLGYFFTEHFGDDINVDKYLLPIVGVIVLLSFAPAVVEFILHKKRGRAKATESSTN